MECDRKLIYFSTYENGEKVGRAGHAGIFIREDTCDVQLYYRESAAETGKEPHRRLYPVYVFSDGTVTEGAALVPREGMAMANIRTGRKDFMQSGRAFEELEVIYIDGVERGICGGRPDGRELTAEVAYTLEEKVEEEKQEHGTPCRSGTQTAVQGREQLLWLLMMLAGK